MFVAVPPLSWPWAGGYFSLKEFFLLNCCLKGTGTDLSLYWDFYNYIPEAHFHGGGHIAFYESNFTFLNCFRFSFTFDTFKAHYILAQFGSPCHQQVSVFWQHVLLLLVPTLRSWALVKSKKRSMQLQVHLDTAGGKIPALCTLCTTDGH